MTIDELSRLEVVDEFSENGCTVKISYLGEEMSSIELSDERWSLPAPLEITLNEHMLHALMNVLRMHFSE